MVKFLKWTGGIIVVLGLFMYFFGFSYLKEQTKKNSPQQTVELNESIDGSSSIKITVEYSRPFKKERDIFGGLVPFGKVWRTGANENTIFTTDKDLMIGDNKLPVGKYSLWTIPNKDTWSVIWNKKQYSWGVTVPSGDASREPEMDALEITVPTETQMPNLQQFTISMQKDSNTVNLNLAWDATKVVVPMKL